MSITLAVDELLHRHDFGEIAAQILAALPLAEVDQLAAAGRDAHAAIRAIAGGGGGAPVGLAPGDVPGWLRLGALDALVSHMAGTATTCVHQPGPCAPVQAAAWRPNLVVCLACTRLTALRPRSEADRRCDGCGHVCAGPDAGDLITPIVVQVGVLIYRAGVCGDCVPAGLGAPG